MPYKTIDQLEAEINRLEPYRGRNTEVDRRLRELEDEMIYLLVSDSADNPLEKSRYAMSARMGKFGRGAYRRENGIGEFGYTRHDRGHRTVYPTNVPPEKDNSGCVIAVIIFMTIVVIGLYYVALS